MDIFLRVFFSRFCFPLLLVSATGSILWAQVTEPIDNDYWIVVPANYPQAVGLSLSSPVNTKVRIKYGTTQITRTVNPGSVMEPNMPLITQHKQIVKRGIHVWSLDSLPFTATLVIGPEEYGEFSWCIPTNALGKCYRIAAYNAIDTTDAGGTFTVGSEFAVAATQDSTHITIDFPPGKVIAPINIIMNAGEAYRIDCGNANIGIDPTGTRVTGDKPISVYAGHKRAIVPLGRSQGTLNDGLANSLMEQMIPVESWGKIHMTIGAVTRAQDNYRFLADEDNTAIYLDGAAAPVATINAGEYFETALSGAHEISSSKPIMVAEYIQSGITLFSVGGPAMLILPSTDRYFSSSNFKFESSSSTGAPALCVIAPKAYVGQVEYDGTLINPSTFIPMPQGALNPVPYSFATILNPSMGYHTLRYNPMPAVNPNSLYGYFVAGDGDRDENEIQSVGYRGARYPLLSVGNLLDYATLICDTEKTLTLSVKNIGAAPLVIDSAVIAGVNAGDFTRLAPTLFPDSIGIAKKRDYTIRFYPKGLGDRKAELRLYTKDYDCNAHGLVPKLTIIALQGRKDVAAITRTPAFIDFGKVRCTDYDTVVTITNVGTVNVTLNTAKFTAAGLTILSPALPKVIAPGASVTVKIRLTASAVPGGTYTSALQVACKPCNLSADFSFTAEREKLEYDVTPDSVNFGITQKNKTSSGSMFFINRSSVVVRVGGAKFDDPAFPGTVTGPSFPQRVAPGDSLRITFTVTPTDTIAYRANLRVTADSECVDGRFIPVAVEAAGVCPQATVTEAIGKVPSDVVSIPIVIDPSTKFASAKQIDVTVTYPPELLRYASDPTTTLPGATISKPMYSNGQISFTLTTSSLPTPKATIAEIHVQALLAPRADGEIVVTVSNFTLASGETITNSGTGCATAFSLGAGCVRPDVVKTRSGAMMKGVYPNPAQSSATLILSVEGTPTVQIEIYDNFGRKVETLLDGVLKGAHREFIINTEAYSNGIYFCRLTENGKTSTTEFNVQK